MNKEYKHYKFAVLLIYSMLCIFTALDNSYAELIIGKIDDLTINEDTISDTLSFTVWTTIPQTLTISYIVTNNELISPNGISFVGEAIQNNVIISPIKSSNVILVIKPTTNISGTTGITVSVTNTQQITVSEFFMLTVLNINDDPELSISQSTYEYIENSVPIKLVQTIGLVDVDDEYMSKLEIWIQKGYDKGKDILDCSQTLGLAKIFDKTTGKLILSGIENINDYFLALKSITFENISDSPNEYTRTILFKLFDNNSNNSGDGIKYCEESISIRVISRNDPPTITHINDISLLEDQTIKPILFNIEDVDDRLLHITIKSSNVSVISDESIVLNDKNVSLDNIIQVIKMLAGFENNGFDYIKDINNDKKIGLNEIVYCLNSFTLPVKEYSMQLTPVPNIHGNTTITITAFDSQGLSISQSFSLFINAKADTPGLKLPQEIFGYEDQFLSLQLEAWLNDNDKSEELYVKVSNVPKNAVLSTGEQDNNGDWIISQDTLNNIQFKPSANEDGIYNLSVQAFAKEKENNDIAGSTIQNIHISISGVPDKPILEVKSNISGSNENPIPMSISPPIKVDDDETLSSITISGMPSNALLSNGKNNNDGSWTLTIDQLHQLSFQLENMQDDKQIIQLEVSVSSIENNKSATTKEKISIEVTKQRLKQYGSDKICFINTSSYEIKAYQNLIITKYWIYILFVILLCSFYKKKWKFKINNYLQFVVLFMLSIFTSDIFADNNFVNYTKKIIPDKIEISVGPAILNIDESNASDEFILPPHISIDDNSQNIEMKGLYQIPNAQNIFAELSFNYIPPVSYEKRKKKIDIDIKNISLGCKWLSKDFFNYPYVDWYIYGGLGYMISSEKIEYEGKYERDDSGLGCKIGAGLELNPIKSYIPLKLEVSHIQGFGGVEHIRSVDTIFIGCCITIDKSNNKEIDGKKKILERLKQTENLLRIANNINIASSFPKEMSEIEKFYSKTKSDFQANSISETTNIDQAIIILQDIIQKFVQDKTLLPEKKIQYIKDYYYSTDKMVELFNKEYEVVKDSFQKGLYDDVLKKNTLLLEHLDQFVVTKELEKTRIILNRIHTANGHINFPTETALVENMVNSIKSNKINNFDDTMILKKKRCNLLKKVANAIDESSENAYKQSLIVMDITDPELKARAFIKAKESIIKYLQSIKLQEQEDVKLGVAYKDTIDLKSIHQFKKIKTPLFSEESHIIEQINFAFSSFNALQKGPKKVIYIISEDRSIIAESKIWENEFDFKALLTEQKSFNCIIVGKKRGDGLKRLTEETGGFFYYADKKDGIYKCLKEIIEKLFFIKESQHIKT